MHAALLLKGICIGLLVSIPSGPVGFLCVKRTLEDGVVSGIVSALGSIVADIFFAIVVIFGLHDVARFFSSQTHLFRLAGGVILMVLGARTYMEKHAHHPSVGGLTLTQNFGSTLLVTLTNPIQILSFSLVFSIVNALGTSISAREFFLGGFILGAIGMWALLIIVFTLLRARFTDRSIRIFNKLAGIIIGVTGIIILGTLVF